MTTPRPFNLPWLALSLLLVAGGLIYLLGPILTPFLAGALLAYMFDPLVDRLETHGWSRVFGTVAVIVLAGLAVAGLILIALPLFQGQFAELSQRLPAFLDLLQTRFLPWLQETLGITIAPNLDALKSWMTEQATENSDSWLPSLQTGALAVLGLVINLLLIPVVMFYLLKDWDVIVARVAALVPRPWMGTATRVARSMDAVVGEFMRGQLAVMTLLALYHAIALWVLGLDYALPIGILTGLLSFVPFLGIGLGLTLALLVALLQFGDWSGVAWVAGIFMVGQLIESYVITPRIVGERVGLHPVAVIFALAAFGQLFGFVGVLLAVPLAAVLLVALRELRGVYETSTLYRGGYNAASFQPTDPAMSASRLRPTASRIAHCVTAAGPHGQGARHLCGRRRQAADRHHRPAVGLRRRDADPDSRQGRSADAGVGLLVRQAQVHRAESGARHRAGNRRRGKRARPGERPRHRGEKAESVAGRGDRARLSGRFRLEGIPGQPVGVRHCATSRPAPGRSPARTDLHAIDQGGSRRTRRKHCVRADGRGDRNGSGPAGARRQPCPVQGCGRVCAHTRHHHRRHQVRIRTRRKAGRLVWIDEALTPDSSRFWPADQYRPGSNPPSFDKQFVRDWLEASGWNKQAPGPELPAEIVAKTSEKYREAMTRLLG
jgi:predicted PurR-regulated permease PerM